MKLTEWYPADVKPVRVGVYERDFGAGSTGFSKWTGTAWMFRGVTPDVAGEHTLWKSANDLPWRGLAEKP